MPSLNLKVPNNVEITSRNDDKTFIQVPRTKFWVVGEKQTGNLWDVWLIDPEKNKKTILRKNITLMTFAIFSNVVLRSPFPTGKRDAKIRNVKYFINKLTKNNAQQHKRKHSSNSSHRSRKSS